MMRKQYNRRIMLLSLIVTLSMTAAALLNTGVAFADDGVTPDSTLESVQDPAATPTSTPTETPNGNPTESSTETSTETPAGRPTEEPSGEPVEPPAQDPDAAPTETAAETPCETPTDEPTPEPTADPTGEAAAESSATPTEEPTQTPTATMTPVPLAALKIPDGEIVPNRYIVVYKDSVKASRKQAAIKSFVESRGGQLKFVYDKALNGYSAYLPEKALQAVLADPDVAYVEADMVISINDGEDISAQDTQSGATWGLDRIDQRDLPLDTQYTYETTAASVHVYVIDTGIRSTHVDFGGRASKDFDGVGDGEAGNDCDGHGTHVAGTIGGQTYGVAKGVYLHGVRVLDCNGDGYASMVIAGINWVIGHLQLPAVANLSLAGGISASLDSAINDLINAGVTTVVAAGNDGGDACEHSPARVPNAITVGNTTASDARSSSSNYGPCLDLFAPGTYITSDYVFDDEYNYSDTATAVMSGTSMAAPHVAGAAALYLQMNPSASPATVAAYIMGNATTGKVTNIDSSSPDLLVYSLSNFIPTPSSPSGTITDVMPVYQWTEVYGATHYQLQVFQGTSLVSDTVMTTGSRCSSGICQALADAELGAGVYDWRIRAYLGGAWYSYSDYLNFEVSAGTVPTPASPGGTIAINQPAYSWNRIAGAAYYQLEIYSTSGLVDSRVMSSSVCSGSTCSTSPTVILNSGWYKWRVRVYINSSWAEYSSYLVFRVYIAPTLISPGGTIYTTRPTYSWGTVTGATSYQLQIYSTSGLVDSRVMNSGVCSGSTCSTSPDVILNSGWYKWRVRAYLNGSWADYSSYLVFRVYIAPTLISPGGTIYTTRPTYSWSTVTGTTSYQLQIYSTTALVDSRVMNSGICSGSTCSTSPNVILSSGWYKWRVRAYLNSSWADYSSYKVIHVVPQ